MPHNNNLRKIEDKVDRLQRKITNQNNLINDSITLNDEVQNNLNNLLQTANQNVELDNYDRLPYGIYKRTRDIFVDKDASVNLENFDKEDLFPGLTSLKLEESIEGRHGFRWAISGQTDKRDNEGNLVYKDTVNVTLSDSTTEYDKESVKITFSQPHGLNPFENQRLESMVRQVHYKLNWGVSESSSELESRFFLDIPNANEIVIEKSLLTDSDWDESTSGTFQLSEYQDTLTPNTTDNDSLYYDEFISQYKNSDDTPIKILKKSEGSITSYTVFVGVIINTLFIDNNFQNVLVEEYLGNPTFAQFVGQDSLPFNTYAFNPVRPLFTLDSEINPENGTFKFSFDKLRTGLGILLLIPVTLWKEKYESALLKNDNNGNPIVPDVEEVITEFYKGLSPIELGNLNLDGTVKYGLETEYNIWKGLVSMNAVFYNIVQTAITQYLSGKGEQYDVILTSFLGSNATDTISALISSGAAADQSDAISILTTQLLNQLSGNQAVIQLIVQGITADPDAGPIIGLLNINGYTIPSLGVGPELFSEASPYLGIAGKIASGQEVREEFLNDFSTDSSPFVLEILAVSGNNVSDVGARWLKTPDKIILNLMYEYRSQNEASETETDLLTNTHRICAETDALTNTLFADNALSQWHDICPDLFPDFPLIRNRRFNFEPSINSNDQEQMAALQQEVSLEIQTAISNNELTTEQQQTLETGGIETLIGQEILKRVGDSYYVPIFLVGGVAIVRQIPETNFGNIGSIAFGPYKTLNQLAGRTVLDAVPLYSVEDQSKNDLLPDTLIQDVQYTQLNVGITCEILEVREGEPYNNTINLWKSVHNNLVGIHTNEYLEVTYNTDGNDIYRRDDFGSVCFISKNANNEDQIILLIKYLNEAPNGVPNNMQRYYLSSLEENPLLKVSIFQFEDVVDGKIKTLGLIDQNNNIIVLSVISNDDAADFPVTDGYPSNNLKTDYPPSLPAPPEPPVQPTFTFFPDDITVELDNDELNLAPSNTGTPTAKDSNNNPISTENINFLDNLRSFDAGNNFTFTREWTATDSNGNEISRVQTITVVDTTAPTFTFFPDDKTLNSGENTDPENTGTPTFSDNSEALGDLQPVPVSLTPADTQETDANGNIVITRTWTATDGNGNKISEVQTITVLPPLPDIQPLQESVNFNREAQTLTVQVTNNGSTAYTHDYMAMSTDSELNTHGSNDNNNYNMTGLTMERTVDGSTEKTTVSTSSLFGGLNNDLTFKLPVTWTIPANTTYEYKFNFSDVDDAVKDQMENEIIYLMFNEDGARDESDKDNNTVAFIYQKPSLDPDIQPLQESVNFNREAQTLTVEVTNNGSKDYGHQFTAFSPTNDLDNDNNYSPGGLTVTRSDGTAITVTGPFPDKTFRMTTTSNSTLFLPANTTLTYTFNLSGLLDTVKDAMNDNTIYLQFNEDNDISVESDTTNNVISFTYEKPLPDIQPISVLFDRQTQILTVEVSNNGDVEYKHGYTAISKDNAINTHNNDESDEKNYDMTNGNDGITVERERSDGTIEACEILMLNSDGDAFIDRGFKLQDSNSNELTIPANTTYTYRFNFSNVTDAVKEQMASDSSDRDIYLIFNENGDNIFTGTKESNYDNNGIGFRYQKPTTTTEDPLPDIQPLQESVNFDRQTQTLTVQVTNNGSTAYTHDYMAMSTDSELNTHGSIDNNNYNMTGLTMERTVDGSTEKTTVSTSSLFGGLNNDLTFKLPVTWSIPANTTYEYKFNFSSVDDAVKDQMENEIIYLMFNEDGARDESDKDNNTVAFTYQKPSTELIQIWTQVGDDIDGEASGDFSGFSVSLSADGSRVAIGADLNNGNGLSASGHVRIYQNDNGTWTKVGDDIDGEASGDNSGFSVSLSPDGSRVAIGATGNDGNGTSSGHVRIYEYTSIDNEWTQVGGDIDGEAEDDRSGFSVSLSVDGSRVAIGAIRNGGNETNSGHVRIYEYTSIDNEWTKVGGDIDGEAEDDNSGFSVSLSADGSRVAIGADLNDGNNGTNSGHVRIYEYTSIDNEWTQVGGDIDGEAEDDKSGFSVSLSADGSRVAIGAPRNDGNGTNSGHVRIYEYTSIDNEWTQVGGDINGEKADDNSGVSVSLSADGSRVAIGADLNDGNNGTNSGHVRIYEYTSIDNEWTQVGDDIDGEAEDDKSGASVSLSADGSTVAIGAAYTNNDKGQVRIYQLIETEQPVQPASTLTKSLNKELKRLNRLIKQEQNKKNKNKKNKNKKNKNKKNKNKKNKNKKNKK